MSKPLITVFTPTYNRAYCLGGCYESMKRQTNKNFVWLIIDDGSSDNTKELVDGWLKENNEFEIKYIYKKNGGMHTAYNSAYEVIDTELCMNVDSDDWLTDTAIEDVVNFWSKNKREDIGGIYALDMFENGKVIGEYFPDDLTEFRGWGYKTIFYKDKTGKNKKIDIHGDKKFIGVTKVINQYPPFPVYENENYYSLFHKQHYIERDYTILIFNKPVCVVEYREDGNSNNMYKQYIRNCHGFSNYRKFIIKNAPSLKIRFMTAIHYVAESSFAKSKHFILNSPRPILTLMAYPAGMLLKFVIKRKSGS